MVLPSRQNSMMSAEYCQEPQCDEDQSEDMQFAITKAFRQDGFTTVVEEAGSKQQGVRSAGMGMGDLRSLV